MDCKFAVIKMSCKRDIKKRNKEIMPKMKKIRLLAITSQEVIGKNEWFDSIIFFSPNLGAPKILLPTVLSNYKNYKFRNPIIRSFITLQLNIITADLLGI